MRIDSGWNCTPSTACSRWRRPITTPSSVSAVTSRPAGTDAVDHQRVVAGGLERVGQAGEHAGAAVVDQRRLAVHHLRRPHDLAAEHLADALVAEAHAEHRATPAKRRSRRWTGRRPRAARDRGRSGRRRGRGPRSRRGPARRADGRAARRPARPGTARGCRRSCRSCRSRARAAPRRARVAGWIRPPARVPSPPAGATTGCSRSRTRPTSPSSCGPTSAPAATTCCTSTPAPRSRWSTPSTPPARRVLLDIGLRGFSGFEAYELMRAERRFDHMPIIVVSADATVRYATASGAAPTTSSPSRSTPGRWPGWWRPDRRGAGGDRPVDGGHARRRPGGRDGQRGGAAAAVVRLVPRAGAGRGRVRAPPDPELLPTEPSWGRATATSSPSCCCPGRGDAPG